MALTLATLVWSIAHAADGYEDASSFHRIDLSDSSRETRRVAPVAPRRTAPNRRAPKPVKAHRIVGRFFRSRAGL
jgi:hypothetical protein